MTEKLWLLMSLLSFVFQSFKTLQTFIKYIEIDILDLPESAADVVMEDAPAKKDRATEYTKYISHQRKMCIYYTFEKGHKHDEACTLANVSTYTVRK
jgi:hypothetical protein